MIEPVNNSEIPTLQHDLRFEGLSLTVANVDASIAFYGGLLGLEVAHNASPDFAMIKIGGGQFLIIDATKLSNCPKACGSIGSYF